MSSNVYIVPYILRSLCKFECAHCLQRIAAYMAHQSARVRLHDMHSMMIDLTCSPRQQCLENRKGIFIRVNVN